MEAFSQARPRLEKQYEHAIYDQDSGCGPEEIQARMLQYETDNPGKPRILRKAQLLNLIFRYSRIVPEVENYFAGKVADYGLITAQRQQWWQDAWEKQDKSGGMTSFYCSDYSLHGVGYMIDVSHISPDWVSILKLGFTGLRERAQSGNTPMHQAAALVYDGAIELCRRLGTASRNPALLALSKHPPQTLREAFQMAYLFHELAECEGVAVRSMGWFDRLYYDFYRQDIAAGRVTRNEAKEMLKYFWIAFYAKHQGLKFGKNFCFGPAINELSYLGLEVYHEMNIVDPKLSLRVRPDTPQDFLELAALNIRAGRNGIVMLNDEVIIAGLIKHGRRPEDAQDYIPIGCYEPAVLGKEVSLSGATHVSLASILQLFLQDECVYPDFQTCKKAFLQRIRQAIDYMLEMQRRCERAWPEVSPAPFTSGSFPNCLRTGKDLSAGGLEYNSTGCTVSQLADAVDSLTAIDYLVYQKKFCTFAELKKALAANWQGFEQLQLIAKNCPPKWGNNDDQADAIAVEIARFSAPLLNHTPNARGGNFFASIYGQHVVQTGSRLGASPDGRNAGEPVAKNMDACLGMDRSGITALMNSVLKIDMTDYPCGTCLDLLLHPSTVSGEGGTRTLVCLIRAFLSKGGSGLQFNIFAADTLKAAQIHPERYRNLQVRVCGWNARFVDLSTAEQNTFIKQAEAQK